MIHVRIKGVTLLDVCVRRDPYTPLMSETSTLSIVIFPTAGIVGVNIGLGHLDHDLVGKLAASSVGWRLKK